ncbi:MAG: glycosyltransferase, partial [Chloroflexota bacterium]
MARICVVRQYHFPLDPRVRREVYALLDAGHDVDVLCLRQAGEPAYERNGSLRVIRLPLPRRRGGALSYVFQYAAFFSSAFLLTAALHLWRQYALIQVHSLPDALVFAALVPRLGGARVILDLHEPMPEFVASKFGKSMHHPLVRLVAWIEQRSIGFADAVLTCTESMKEQFVRRGGPPRKIAVILNGSDESVFHPRVARLPNAEAKHCVVISHGSVEDRYGLGTVIRAIEALKDEIQGL